MDMFSRFAALALAGVLTFVPGAHLTMTNDRGVLFLSIQVGGTEPLLFIFDPGGQDVLTTYGQSRLGGKPLFPVLSGDPEQLDPRHDPKNGVIAGSIGPALLEQYAVRIDYGNSTVELLPFGTFSAPANAEQLPMQLDTFEMPTVEATIDGLRGRFEIDVRAQSSMLFTPFVRAHNVSAPYPHTVAIGRYVVRDATVRLSSASSGKFASPDVAGLIGNDILSRFVLTLDYRRHLISFQQ